MSNKNTKNPTKILEISREFVTKFYDTASAEDKAWIKESIEQHMQKTGNVKYFAGFRSDFAMKYFPELAASKKPKKTESLLDTLRARDETSNTK